MSLKKSKIPKKIIIVIIVRKLYLSPSKIRLMSQKRTVM